MTIDEPAPRRRVAVSVVRRSLLTFAIATAAGAAFVAGFTDGSLRDWLVLLGGSYEVSSIFLIASPELVPRARRWLMRLRKRTYEVGGRIAAAIRHMLGRKTKVRAFATLEADISPYGDLTVRASIDDSTTLEEKVAYLLRRDQEVQNSFEQFRAEMDSRSSDLQAEFATALGATHSRFELRIRELEDAYIDLRLIGVVILLAGVVLSTIGNLT